jgi:hypothetical protein
MAMNPRTKRILRLALSGVAVGAVVGLAKGCKSGPDHAIHGEMFPADSDVRPVDRMVEVQSAAAARSDATLNAAHFDRGAALNSLGRAKLDLMLRDDDESLPMVVYLDVRDAGGATDAHRDAVRHYLADRGVADAQLEFRTGPNLEYTRPARDGLRGLKKLDGSPDEGGGGEPKQPWATVDMIGVPPTPKK